MSYAPISGKISISQIENISIGIKKKKAEMLTLKHEGAFEPPICVYRSTKSAFGD